MDEFRPPHSDFLRLIRQGEARLSADAERALYEGYLGERGAGLYGALGVGLDLLSGVASCRWGCKNADHDLERLVRRFVNACLASLRLSFAGYNDEALATVRVAAETINLLQLFDAEPTRHAHWLQLDPRRRRVEYGPAPVRRHLEATGGRPFYDQYTYGLLSEGGVHLSPEVVSASHDLESDKLWVGPAVSVPAILLV